MYAHKNVENNLWTIILYSNFEDHKTGTKQRMLMKYAQSPSQYNFITTFDNQQKNARQRTFLTAHKT